jgi:hypothetical protein
MKVDPYFLLALLPFVDKVNVTTSRHSNNEYSHFFIPEHTDIDLIIVKS